MKILRQGPFERKKFSFELFELYFYFHYLFFISYHSKSLYQEKQLIWLSVLVALSDVIGDVTFPATRGNTRQICFLPLNESECTLILFQRISPFNLPFWKLFFRPICASYWKNAQACESSILSPVSVFLIALPWGAFINAACSGRKIAQRWKHLALQEKKVL